MKKNSHMFKGFTLIEVLISLVILSIITVITSTFLQSSIQSKEIVFSQSAQTLRVNLLGDTLREDIANAVNVSLIDTRGEPQPHTFESSLNADSFIFTTKVRAGKNFSDSLARIEYLFDGSRFLRKQFYASAPANSDDFFQTILLNNVTNVSLEFSDKNSWSPSWPKNTIDEQKFPQLIRIYIEQDQGKSYTWVINSNLHNSYE